MKSIKYQILITLICFSTASFGQSFPDPVGFVNDFENIYTERQVEILDSLVKNFEKKTTIEISIVTLDDSYTTKTEFNAYTLKLAKAWGVGKRENDNGILIAISASLRIMRISNGYGIEKILDDRETQEIVDNQFIPYFKNGEYFNGTKVGLNKVIEKLTSRTGRVESIVDSISICGIEFKSPENCSVIAEGLIHCDTYAINWVYVESDQLERHKSESKQQLKHPKKIHCYILDKKVVAYKTKFEPGIQITYNGIINNQAVLIQLWFEKDIKSNGDIPEYLKQMFKLAEK